MFDIKRTLHKRDISNGYNTCRVAKFMAREEGKRSENSGSANALYKVTLSNLYGNTLDMLYAVPHGQKPHQLIKDLYILSQTLPNGTKTWCDFLLVEANGLLCIRSIEPCPEEEQENIERLSGLARTENLLETDTMKIGKPVGTGAAVFMLKAAKHKLQ